MDLNIRDARESRYKEFLAPSFTSALTTRLKDRAARKEKLRFDHLLDHKLDKVVDDESRTNRKVSHHLLFFLILVFRWKTY